MKRSISTLLTTLLLSTVAIVPNAMAQMQNPIPMDSSSDSAASSERPVADSPKLTATSTEMPAAPKSQASDISTIRSEKSRPGVDRPIVGNSYPAYCPFLPAGAKPDDWEYREALEKCLYGT